MEDLFNHSVALAKVDFQNEVRVLGSLPEALSTYLRTEAFPTSAPPSLRSAPDYSGIKIFVYQKHYICIAYFFDGNKTDDFQRAIPSATVLVFDRDLQQRGFRNLPALSGFLADLSLSTSTFDEHLFVLHSIYVEASITDSENQFQAFLVQQGVNYELVAIAMGLLMTYRHLVICCPDRAAGQAFFSTLFALAPIEFLETTAWCTYTDSIQGQHEDVVVHTCQLETPEPKSWLDKVRSRFGDEKKTTEGCVDIGNGVALGCNRKAPNYRLAEKVIHELRDDKLKLPGTFEDRFSLFLGVLGRSYSELPYDVNLLLPKSMASDDVVARFESFIENVSHK
jgi:hypothetical protein